MRLMTVVVQAPAECKAGPPSGGEDARYFLSHDAFRSSIRPFEDARYFLEDGDAACARTAAYVEGAQL